MGKRMGVLCSWCPSLCRGYFIALPSSLKAKTDCKESKLCSLWPLIVRIIVISISHTWFSSPCMCMKEVEERLSDLYWSILVKQETSVEGNFISWRLFQKPIPYGIITPEVSSPWNTETYTAAISWEAGFSVNKCMIPLILWSEIEGDDSYLHSPTSSGGGVWGTASGDTWLRPGC